MFTRSGRFSLLMGWVFLMAVLAASVGEAGPVSWLKRSPVWPWGWPEALIVTGNYAEPRLLAEMAQRKTKQPLIVVSREEDGDRIYYLPYKKKEALPLAGEEYVEFVETMLRPKRIIFLGDDQVLARRYIEPLRKNYPVVVLEGEDWGRTAGELGRILRTWTLKGDFEKAREKMMTARSHRQAYDPEGETVHMPMAE